MPRSWVRKRAPTERSSGLGWAIASSPPLGTTSSNRGVAGPRVSESCPRGGRTAGLARPDGPQIRVVPGTGDHAVRVLPSGLGEPQGQDLQANRERYLGQERGQVGWLRQSGHAGPFMLRRIPHGPDQPVGVGRGERDEVIVIPERDGGAVQQVLDVISLSREP